MPEPGDNSYIFQVESSDKRTARIVADASSGRILGELQSGWVAWMIDAHRNLLAGTAGRKIVGAFGIVLLILTSTAAWMWLSGARNWRSWITVRQGSRIRLNYELHRAAGLWAIPLLTVITFTGVERAFPDVFRAGAQALTPKSLSDAAYKPPKKGKPGKPGKSKAEAALPLDEYLRLGRAAMPDGQPVEMRLGGGSVDLRLYRSGDVPPSANHVYLDPQTGAVIQIDRLADHPLAARVLAAFATVHYGEFGGVTIKIVWAIVGIAPLLLFLTGLFTWWRPAKRKQNTLASSTANTEELVAASRF
jgi:uncharacterized iron-regulated membrane protein